MKRCLLPFLLLMAVPSFALQSHAETEQIDLKALAKKARPAVMLLVVSDASGKEIATGTGFLVSSDGKLITNHHVIEGAASVVAKAENGGLFPVVGVLASDPKNDLVLLKLTGKDLPFLTLGKSEKIEIGTRIAVIGSPLGLEGTLSEGIVSAVRELMDKIKVLQVTAAISPGSSGSPVMNAEGNVIGVASALLRSGQALNFAVPVEFANSLLAKVQPAAKPQPLREMVSSDRNAFNSDPDLWAGWFAEASGDYVEMLKRAKVLVDRYPENPDAQRNLGSAYWDLKFIDEAIAAARQAIKLKPDYAEAWDDLGFAYLGSGRAEDAITAYRQVIKLKPDYAEAWSALGLAYHNSGRTDDAIAALRQAVRLKPDFADAWLGLSVNYGLAGRTEEAASALQRARDALQRARELKPELTKPPK